MTASLPPASLPVQPSGTTAAFLRQLYIMLDAAYRDDVWHWMPEVAPDPMEIIAGAILVQHTTWTNAQRALDALRQASGLDAATLIGMQDEDIQKLVRVSGTPTIKARRLRAICEAIVRAGGVEALLSQPLAQLRAALLATHGIGPESADAIALYAGARPVFVIDAYTRRLVRRLGRGPVAGTYDAWQRYFEDALGTAQQTTAGGDQTPIVDLFRRYHGYIVLHGKMLCRAVPRCTACPLLDGCVEGRRRTEDAATKAILPA